MKYQVLELPLNSSALAIQQAINQVGLTLVSMVADTVNNRFILLFTK